ncbi:MAG: glutamate--tRNA ligase [Pseudomonadota bacterium]|nr:glutamate--tRNA ligase [Pseudomonadota bacterium]
MSSIRTRFPPSPTGYLHVGGARTALFNWLYARKTGGDFVLRIEDTDRERSTQEAVDVILQGMEWLGLDWDEGPFYQTDRFDRYREVIRQLLDEEKAYYCYCSKQELAAMREAQKEQGLKPRYDRRCRGLGRQPEAGESPVVRFRNPLDGAVVFDDVVRGRVVISNDELDDLIIARADGTPTYNLTVVVDDMDMGITHVVRGDDHTNNTPRQINILKALGAPVPVYAHVPMILGPDGQRLSKRHGAVSVLQYRDMGILPEALLNYLVRLGWSHGDQEIFSIEEMTALFDIADINKAASSFDPDKLLWVNQHYIKQADQARLVEALLARLHARGVDTEDGPAPELVVEALRERARTLEELADKSEYLYHETIEFEEAAAKKHLRPVAEPLLAGLKSAFADLGDWQPEPIHKLVQRVAEEHGVKLGKIAQPLRVAVSGTAATPSIDVTVMLVGKRRTLQRLEQAIDFIQRRAGNSA